MVGGLTHAERSSLILVHLAYIAKRVPRSGRCGVNLMTIHMGVNRGGCEGKVTGWLKLLSSCNRVWNFVADWIGSSM